MKNDEKESVMNSFKNNESQILISTTVIEVGVDVKNATMIVIFNAEQFGLATLHQLRGRVGRNDFDCSCILISNEEKERLQILVNSNNGFDISEEDFKTLQLAKKDSDAFLENNALEKIENEHILKMIEAKNDYVS